MDWWRKPVVLEKTSTAGCPAACRVVAAGAARAPGAEQAARGTARTRPSSSGTARRERRRTLVGGHLLVARRRLDAPARRCRGDPAPVRRIAAADPGEVAVCSAVRVVVAAAERARRLALRRATVTAEWEVV